jgi:hypothetical protein
MDLFISILESRHTVTRVYKDPQALDPEAPPRRERDDDLINSILLDAQTAAPEHKSSPRRGIGLQRHNGEGHNLYSSMEASRATGDEDEISLFVTSGQARRRASAVRPIPKP